MKTKTFRVKLPGKKAVLAKFIDGCAANVLCLELGLKPQSIRPAKSSKKALNWYEFRTYALGL